MIIAENYNSNQLDYNSVSLILPKTPNQNSRIVSFYPEKA